MKHTLWIMALAGLMAFSTGCGKDKKDKKSSVRVDRRGRTGGDYTGSGNGSSGTVVNLSTPSYSDPTFGQLISQYNQGASLEQLASSFLGQQLNGALKSVKLRFVNGGLIVEIWDAYAVSKNDPFVGGFQRTGTVPFNNLQCYEFMDPQGYVYVCGQPSGNNFEGIFIFENNNNADGVLGRFRGNQCLLTGGCS